MTEINLNPDHAHNPERTGHTANVMSECVRVLNYAVEKGGLHHASDGYRLVGELRRASGLMDELLGRLVQWAKEQAGMGAWEVDMMKPDRELGELLSRFLAAVGEGQAAAGQLYDSMSKAQSAIGRIKNTGA